MTIAVDMRTGAMVDAQTVDVSRDPNYFTFEVDSTTGDVIKSNNARSPQGGTYTVNFKLNKNGVTTSFTYKVNTTMGQVTKVDAADQNRMTLAVDMRTGAMVDAGSIDVTRDPNYFTFDVDSTSGQILSSNNARSPSGGTYTVNFKMTKNGVTNAFTYKVNVTTGTVSRVDAADLNRMTLAVDMRTGAMVDAGSVDVTGDPNYFVFDVDSTNGQILSSNGATSAAGGTYTITFKMTTNGVTNSFRYKVNAKIGTVSRA